MNFTDIILAIVQGATEFLPVSSSGHLILLQELFRMDAGLAFDIVLHAGTLVAVLYYYRREVLDLACGFFSGLAKKIKNPEQTVDPRFKIVLYLILATAITAGIGLLFQPFVETEFRSMTVVGILLIINSAILTASRFEGAFNVSAGELNWKSALILGLAQGIAVLPGISRSGMTITTALLLGIPRKDCASYSFILSIPVILGALILHFKDLMHLESTQVFGLILCAGIAAIVGLLCLKFLVSLLKNMRFHFFAPYCLILGAFAIIYAQFFA